MKRIARKLGIVLVTAVSAMLLMTGCGSGSTVNTVLNVNPDMTGSRQMEVVFDGENFDEYFYGSIDDLNMAIQIYCPSDLSWDYQWDGYEEEYVYLFTLDYTSLEDYKTKVENITGEEHEISLSVPDSVWVNGVYVEEDFTSEDLMAWLKDALRAEVLLDEDYIEDLFGIGDTSVVYNGTSVSTGYTIYLNRITYERINNIDFLTEIHDVDNYTRTVKFQVPSSSMNDKGDEIRDYMTSVAGNSGVCTETTDDNGNTVFDLTGKNLTAKGLEAFMQSVFGTENASVSLGKTEEKSPFLFGQKFTEKIKLDNYVVGDTSTVCNYFIKMNDEIDYTYDKGMSYGESNTYPGYEWEDDCYYYGDTESMEFPLSVQKAYKAKSLDVASSKDMKSNWERITEITFAEEPPEERFETIMERIDSRIGDSGPEEGDSEEGEVTLEAVKENGLTITITQRGSAEQIQESTAAVFGTAGNLEYESEKGIAKIKKEETLHESVDYSTFLGETAPSFTASYRLKTNIGADMTDCNYRNTDCVVRMASGELSIDGMDAKIDVDYEGTYIDIISIIFWVILVLVLLIILMIILLIVISSSKKKKAAAASGMQPGYGAPQPMAAAPVTPAQTAPAAAPVPTAPADPASEATAPAVEAVPAAEEVPAVEEASAVSEAEAPVASETEATAPAVEAAPAADVAEPAAPASPASETEAPVAEAAPIVETAPVMAAPSFCTNCGTKLVPGNKFCTGCGKKLE